MDEITPFESDAEHRVAERKVVHPETDTRRVRFGDTTLNLRPLPLGVATRLMVIAQEAFNKVDLQDGRAIIGAAGTIGEALIDAMVAIGQFYKVPDISREWVASHLDDGDAWTVLEAQLEQGSRNSFLRRVVLPLLKLVRETAEGLEKSDFAAVKQQIATTFGSPEKPGSTPAFASPGEFHSPSSSSDAPRDSSS